MSDSAVHADELCDRAMNHVRAGDVAGAMDLWREAASLGSTRAMRNMGVTLRDMDRFDEAIEWLQRAMELGDFEAPMNLGWVLMHLGRPHEALAVYEIGAERGHGGCAFGAGQVCRENLGDLAQAERWYELSANLGDPQGLNAHAVVLRAKGRPVEALPFMERAANANEPHAQANVAALRREVEQLAAGHGQASAVPPSSVADAWQGVCAHCGAQRAEDVRFCGQCGREFDTLVADDVPGSHTGHVASPSDAPPRSGTFDAVPELWCLVVQPCSETRRLPMTEIQERGQSLDALIWAIGADIDTFPVAELIVGALSGSWEDGGHTDFSELQVVAAEVAVGPPAWVTNARLLQDHFSPELWACVERGATPQGVFWLAEIPCQPPIARPEALDFYAMGVRIGEAPEADLLSIVDELLDREEPDSYQVLLFLASYWRTPASALMLLAGHDDPGVRWCASRHAGATDEVRALAALDPPGDDDWDSDGTGLSVAAIMDVHDQLINGDWAWFVQGATVMTGRVALEAPLFDVFSDADRMALSSMSAVALVELLSAGSGGAAYELGDLGAKVDSVGSGWDSLAVQATGVDSFGLDWITMAEDV